jgi:hypothetical protein
MSDLSDDAGGRKVSGVGCQVSGVRLGTFTPET